MPEDIDTSVALIARMDAVGLILDIVCRTTGMGFAAVARVTEQRWIACSVRDEIALGLRPGGELDVATTLCERVRATTAPVVIDDAAADPVFSLHPTPKMYGFRSYVSMPIVRANGQVFGTLCALDPRPRHVNTPTVTVMFKAFAELIAAHLDQMEAMDEDRVALAAERHEGVLREEFIAVLGHDLRNPLAAVSGGLHLLQREPQTPRASSVLVLMEGSVRRMTGLIDNVLDFARGRLGGGLHLNLTPTLLQPVLDQVIGELRAAHPDREIAVSYDLADPVTCDGARIAQLFSNLLGNAITHGAQARIIHVQAASHGGSLDLAVTNDGDPIPPAALEKLFMPFYRQSVAPAQQGLGLGLYIASMIARAHGGRMTATSTAAETCFRFLMPG